MRLDAVVLFAVVELQGLRLSTAVLSEVVELRSDFKNRLASIV